MVRLLCCPHFRQAMFWQFITLNASPLSIPTSVLSIHFLALCLFVRYHRFFSLTNSPLPPRLATPEHTFRSACSLQDNERCLLGRQKVWPKGMWSTLAGFMEHGEVGCCHKVYPFSLQSIQIYPNPSILNPSQRSFPFKPSTYIRVLPASSHPLSMQGQAMCLAWGCPNVCIEADPHSALLSPPPVLLHTAGAWDR